MLNTLTKLARANKNIVLLNTEAVGFKDCEEFARVFPERTFSFGLAEGNMISVAAGFALAGKLPIVVGNARFLLERAFEQIKNDICLPNLNVKIVALGENEMARDLLKVLPNIRFFEGDLEEIFDEYGPMYCRVSA